MRAVSVEQGVINVETCKFNEFMMKDSAGLPAPPGGKPALSDTSALVRHLLHRQVSLYCVGVICIVRKGHSASIFGFSKVVFDFAAQSTPAFGLFFLVWLVPWMS